MILLATMKQLPEDTVSAVPAEILANIVGHLAASDAIKLSHTGKQIQSQLSLAATARRKVLTERHDYTRSDRPLKSFQVPVPSQDMVMVHTVLLSMNWRDQGWGNRKSQVFIIATKNDLSPYGSDSRLSTLNWEGTRIEFDGGRVVYESGIATHSKESLDITFKPKKDETYHIWYIVGGGGGHELYLSDANIQSLVLGDDQGFLDAYNFLVTSEVLQPIYKRLSTSPFHDITLSTIFDSTRHLLTQGERIPLPMISFFGRYGIPERGLSVNFLDTVQKIRDCDQNQEDLPNQGVLNNDEYEDYLSEGSDY